MKQLILLLLLSNCALMKNKTEEDLAREDEEAQSWDEERPSVGKKIGLFFLKTLSGMQSNTNQKTRIKCTSYQSGNAGETDCKEQ